MANQRKEFLDLGDNALLFSKGWERNKPIKKVFLSNCRISNSL